MLTIDDILPLIGMPLDERVIERLCGSRGERESDEFDEDHPEDQRHYYRVVPHSLEMILGDGEVVKTIFFHVRGKRAGYPWALRNGLSRSSSRQAVLAALGTPERSGEADPGDPKACVGYDRFRVGRAVLHFQYADDCESVELVTAMTPAIAPGGE